MLVSVKKLFRFLALFAIPLVMIACDEDDEEGKNPTCPNASVIQGENNRIKLADSKSGMPELFVYSGQKS